MLGVYIYVSLINDKSMCVTDGVLSLGVSQERDAAVQAES